MKRLLHNRVLYIVLAGLIITGTAVYFFTQRKSSNPTANQPTQSDSPAVKTLEDSAQRDPTKTPATTYTYNTVVVTQAMLNSGQVPECCRTFYKDGQQALVIESKDSTGAVTLFWYNPLSAGRTSFEFFPEKGSLPKFVGLALPKSIDEARTKWSILTKQTGQGEEKVRVLEVNRAIQFIQDSFSSIPHSNY